MIGKAAIGLLALSLFAFGTGAEAGFQGQLLAKKGQTAEQCKGDADVKLEDCLWSHPLCKAGYKDDCKQQCGYDRDDAYAKCEKLAGGKRG